MSTQPGCNVCHTSYDKISLLNIHIKNVHTGRSWKCEICLKAYKTKGDLRKHMVKHDPNWQGTFCGICSQRFVSISSHRSRVHEKKIFSCEICTKQFTDRRKLTEHIIMHEGTDLAAYQCQLCTKTFPSNEKLNAHKRCHSNPKDKRTNCQICNKIYPDSGLKKHMKKHNEMRATCNICYKTSSNEANLKTHIFRVHSAESSSEYGTKHKKEELSVVKNFVCKICGKTYNRKTSLDYHTLAHTGERPFKCKKCDFDCRDSATLKRHQMIHNGEKRFQCNNCEKLFGFKHSLDNHLATHTDKRPFECVMCNLTFKTRGDLLRHLKKHNSPVTKLHKCQVCGKSYGQSNQLRKHIQTHSGTKAHNCMQCSYSSLSAGTMKIHNLTHTELYKLHKCDQCAVSFNTVIKLRAHKVSHLTEKRFRCTICDYKSKRKFQLKKHMKHVHTESEETPLQCKLCTFTSTYVAHLKQHISRVHMSKVQVS